MALLTGYIVGKVDEFGNNYVTSPDPSVGLEDDNIYAPMSGVTPVAEGELMFLTTSPSPYKFVIILHDHFLQCFLVIFI